MPKKKTEQAIVDEIMAESGKCGHVNRHSRTNGKPDNLVCAKDRGHAGNHGAEHLELVESPVGEVEIGKKRYTKKMVWCEWMDIAGTPPDKIIPEAVVQKPEDAQRAEWVKNLVGGIIPPGTKIG
jgi:hypothetical protein